MRTQQSKPVTFPCTFRAANVYRWPLAVVSLMGLIGTIYLVTHPTPAVRYIGIVMPVIVFWAVISSLRIHVDENGLTQNWLLNTRILPWNDITRLEKTKFAVSVLDQNNKETIHVGLLSRPAQSAVMEETIKRAKLRKSGEKPKPPTLERWIPKK